MDIRALKYFIEVIKQQSFTKAADQLFVTQPTISKMVKQLEEELDIPLIIREGKKIHLTDAGKVVFARGQDVLHALKQLKIELADLSTLAHGELIVGMPPMAGGAFFAPVLQHFRTQFPNIELKMVEDGAKALETRIRKGQLEIGVAVLPVDIETFEIRPFIDDPMCLVAMAGSKWHGRKTVKLNEITDQNYILFPEDFTLTSRIATAFAKLGIRPKIVGRSAHWDFIAEMVRTNLGITLLPKAVTDRLPNSKFDIVELDDQELRWKLALIWQKKRYLSYAARAWIDVTTSSLISKE